MNSASTECQVSQFEPLSDSCGESDMEGLDLSLFEPQADANSWCDSRVHAGFLYLLVHYCAFDQQSSHYAVINTSNQPFAFQYPLNNAQNTTLYLKKEYTKELPPMKMSPSLAF
ncbi:hypothetical protein TSAR_002619 [Trichomalopsis sarcophagae]|uniref:Uncharacterized protein n=1 Tax=Trichomalopsis sarcophagae TaxID=543379 RepID=A0A232F3J4_9HYME|nr:hypothetical protein TSAR_002619 [Trichomalopsis sarcophagae]